MNLSELAHRHRPVVGLLTVLLMAYGALSYFTLPAREDPQITIREAVVTTHYPGLSAERVELLITKTLEEAIRQVPQIDEIRSRSMPGVSIIHAEVHARYFDLDQIWDELAEKVDAAAGALPDGAGRPQVDDDFGDVAVVTAALTGDDYTMAELFDMAQHVRDQLYGVAGTKRVDLHGARAERIHIEVSNARMAELGLSPRALSEALAGQNVIRPGGEVDTGSRSFIVEPTGNYRTVEDIGETLIRLPGDALVPLRDMARIERGYVDPPRTLAYYNGRPAIVLAIAMQDGERVLDFAPRVRERLAQIETGLPAGYAIDLVTYQAEQVANAVYGVSVNVLQTLAIVLAVVLVFLGVRTGLIVGAIVPTVMLITLAVMGFAGMDLQRMSLATLVIALGLLVDNGIVIAEDYKRRLEEGEDRDVALKRTGGELALPLLASTMTTILVFLPLMLAEHEAGEYTRSISLVILIALATSWLVALTVTPLLCRRFIRVEAPGGDGAARGRSGGLTRWLFMRMNGGYERLLRRVMRRRAPFMLAMLTLLAASVYAVTAAPNKFFPDSDRAQVLVYVDLPAGVTARTTDARMRAVFAMLNDEERFPHLDDFAGYVGYGGPRFVLSLTPIDPAPNRGFIVVNVDGIDAMDGTIARLREAFAADHPDLRARVARMFLGPTDPGVIQIQASGPDADHVFRTGRALEEILAGVPGTIDVWGDWENRVSKIVVEIDQSRARRAGVTSADVSRSMENFYSGHVVSEFREGDDVFPIVSRAETVERGDLGRLRTLAIHRGNRGDEAGAAGAGAGAAAEADPTAGSVALAQIAEVRMVNAFARIARENMTRTLTVEARNPAMSPEDMVPLIEPQIAALDAAQPPGHAISFDGIVTDASDGRMALGANIPLCVTVMIILLVAQFNSFRRPLIIFATIPLLVIGAAIGLHVMNADFGFMVILGLFSLAGIIINNAIVLIDRIDIERAADGADAYEAIIAASVRRLRPIVMTTVTTILGLLPLIVSKDPLFYGMASVIAFGLLVGTVLTLGVVPILYAMVLRIGPAGARA